MELIQDGESSRKHLEFVRNDLYRWRSWQPTSAVFSTISTFSSTILWRRFKRLGKAKSFTKNTRIIREGKPFQISWTISFRELREEDSKSTPKNKDPKVLPLAFWSTIMITNGNLPRSTDQPMSQLWPSWLPKSGRDCLGKRDTNTRGSLSSPKSGIKKRWNNINRSTLGKLKKH